jgi:3-methyladenine DNA glycosylase/8-oxoguanine DNA glycosylase
MSTPFALELEAGKLDMAITMSKPDVMLRRAKRWAPYRSVASWYLWRACDLVKKTAPAGRSAR